ncbi:hypothetical protein E1B28_005494 [Marasmius oreades]|uniref:Uncharacterized protein n=1 Tax=Marasmius oreades TaxID=181124 RepID=A0A9P7S394_9AGAR|nr:uncharacterized protein E1B28_005494 [Marasmius oreades]KAG7094674.1 hypothetical protein E1B28_005494 [Marasmius oreades]
MPRQSRGRSSAPASRTTAPAAPAQSRGAHTAALPAHAAPTHNPAHAPAPPATATQTRQPGMLSQMAATAGSVAVGSTIGHGISSMLFGGGGGSSAPVEQAQAASAPASTVQQSSGINCELQAKEFTKCLEKADLPSCTWYLEQLKAVSRSLLYSDHGC